MSTPLGFHVILRLQDNRSFATSLAALRMIASVVLMQGEQRGLVAFGTADNHLHALLIASRALAGAFALYVETALHQVLDLGARFERARLLPVHDQGHAYNAFHYVHSQDEHHGVGNDLAREGTSLPDIVGLRTLPTSIAARVRAHLPRISVVDLIRGLPPGAFENRPINLDVLADAAAAAFALPDLHGRSRDIVRARRAAVHVGADVPTAVLADCLHLQPRAIRALRERAPEPLVVRAVRGQALLRTNLRIQRDTTPPPLGLLIAR